MNRSSSAQLPDLAIARDPHTDEVDERALQSIGHLLAQQDFSRHSQIRQPLRARLLQQATETPLDRWLNGIQQTMALCRYVPVAALLLMLLSLPLARLVFNLGLHPLGALRAGEVHLSTLSWQRLTPEFQQLSMAEVRPRFNLTPDLALRVAYELPLTTPTVRAVVFHHQPTTGPTPEPVPMPTD